MAKVNFIPFEINTGIENMRIDEDILNQAITSNCSIPTFRLYGWKPACISLGRNQRKDFLDEELLTSMNIDVVTRLTGGRALLHGKEITYSFVCHQDFLSNGGSVTESYKEISQILVSIFDKMGIILNLGGENVHTRHDYCMLVSTGADLNFEGKKLVGSAQVRKKGYILQHGSILYDYDKNLLEQVFKEPVSIDKITTIKEVFGCSQCEFLEKFNEIFPSVFQRLF